MDSVHGWMVSAQGAVEEIDAEAVGHDNLYRYSSRHLLLGNDFFLSEIEALDAAHRYLLQRLEDMDLAMNELRDRIQQLKDATS